MASITGYEKVILCGREYMLKYNLNTVADMEEHYGKGIAAMLTEEQIGMNLIRTFYFYGLKWAYHDITIQKVGDLLNRELVENESANFGTLLQPAMNALKKSRVLGGEAPKKDENDVHLTKTEEEAEPEEDEKPQGESFPE